MFNNLPVLGICGFKNAGKTTLIGQVIPRLSAQGLQVAALKFCGHQIYIDTHGKDSSRLFHSGADVFLKSPHEDFYHIHTSNSCDYVYFLKILCRYYDLVLVEGNKNIPFSKVWLASDEKCSKSPEIEGVIETLPQGSNRPEKLLSFIDNWLPEQWFKTPVTGCILIGGESVRMGMPKHLIKEKGKTWLEKTVEVMRHVTKDIVIAGAGTVPDKLNGITRLPDTSDIQGPMAGIVSVMRWAPSASVLVTACDLPDLSPDALKWLLSKRQPGVWGLIPKLHGANIIEPLLAWYDFRSRTLFEKAAIHGCFSPAQLGENSKICTITPPADIAAAWNNVNTINLLRTHRKTP